MGTAAAGAAAAADPARGAAGSAPVPADPAAGSAPWRQAVPTPLRVTSEICARLLVIAAALALLIFLIVQLRVVFIPVSIALLLCALLGPVVVWLHARRMPRGPATVLTLVAGLSLIGGLLSLVVNTFISGFPELRAQLSASMGSIERLLSGPPLRLPQDWLRTLPSQLGDAVSANRDALTSGALTTAATVGEIVAGSALALFSLIFFLYDGPGIWGFLLRAAPAQRRDRLDVAGRRAFASLVGYVRATVLVAVVDALGIGLGLLVVGVPLAVPLAALVFLGSFIPTVGAVLTGAIAVLVALVANGPVPALIVLGVVIAVQQLEGHVLQPLLLGRAVRLHALAVVLAVAAGVVIAGIVGALLAVPLLAVVNTAVRSLAAPSEAAPDRVCATDPRQAQPSTTTDHPSEPGVVSRLLSRLTGGRRPRVEG